jgi:hypothetical protein
MTRTTILALVLGLGARAALLTIAPRYGFTGDHVDYVCWGREATNDGVLAMYVTPQTPCPAIVYLADQPPRRLTTGSGERLNYPPLSVYVLWVQQRVLRMLDPGETANTVTARVAYAIGTTLGDLLTALGSAALVRLFAGPSTAAAAFALTFLAPPLLLDGAFWGQTEAWVLAPAVWMVWAMIRGRWLLAGALFGVALGLKPSALIFGPLWAYALAFRRPRWQVIAGGLTAVAVMNAAALPFWLTSGPAWVRVVFLDNYVYALHWTTMLTFNVWYADLLVTERLDSQAPLLGVSRDVWGTALLIAGLAVAFLVVRRWERRTRRDAALGLLPLATLVALAGITFPTRVHGTYTAFVIPFAICTAFLIPRTMLAAAALVVASSLQILSWQWGTLLAVHVLPDEHQFPPARYAARRAMRQHDRPREWALTIFNLAAVAAMFAGIAGLGGAPPRRSEPRAL